MKKLNMLKALNQEILYGLFQNKSLMALTHCKKVVNIAMAFVILVAGNSE